MKTIIIITTLWITISANAFSQKATTWIGGTPGMKTDWYCPYNWNTSSVPDEFSDVIIPDVSTTSFASPVIQSGKVEINSINVHSNASLTIGQNATLIVFTQSQGNINKLRGEEDLAKMEKPSSDGNDLSAEKPKLMFGN